MLFIVFTLIFSVTLMLLLTNGLHRFSPYNRLIAGGEVRGLEWVLLYFILAYPFFSLLALLYMPGNIIVYLSEDVAQYQKAYYVFCSAHVLLSLIASSISYPLRKRSQLFNAFFAFSALAGGGYLTAVIAALVQGVKH